MAVTADELIKKQKARSKKKKIIYEKIYERIEKKIQMSSNVNLFKCWYEIPEFLLNLPIYSTDDCMVYLTNKLIKNGFDVLSSNNLIIISWEPQ